MKRIKVKFSGFENYMLRNNIILHVLKENYIVEETEEPDILFYSVFDHEYKKHNCIKVFVSAEPCIPDFNETDYAISSCDLDFQGRHCYYPWYFMLNIDKLLDLQQKYEGEWFLERKFCNFIYSHTASEGGRLRNEFCKTLLSKRKVDCLGSVLHNIDDPLLGERYATNWHENKIAVLKKYKFTVAFENTLQYGYTTEKLIDPLLARSIPIYYGNPRISRYLNSDCFIDATSFEGNWEKLVDYLDEIDRNEIRCLNYLNADIVKFAEIEKTKGDLRSFLWSIVENGQKFEKDPYDFMNKLKIPTISLVRYLNYKSFDFVLRHRMLSSFLYKMKHKIFK